MNEYNNFDHTLCPFCVLINFPTPLAPVLTPKKQAYSLD